MVHEPEPAMPVTEMVEEVLGLLSGLVAMLLPVSILAVPGAALLALAVVPLAAAAIPFALFAALLAPPYLLVRSVRRRRGVP